MKFTGGRDENHMELECTSQRPYVPPIVASYEIPQQVPNMPAEDSVGLDQLMATFWERKSIIAGGVIAGLLIGLAVTLFTTPIYRARVSLQLVGFNNDEFLHQAQAIMPSLPNASPESYLQNEVKLLESETLAKRVADKLGIPASAEIQRSPGGPVSRIGSWLHLHPRMTPEERRIRSVQKALNVRTSLQSQVIEVFYDSADPNGSAQGANAAAAEFITLNQEARTQLAQDTTEWLNKQAVTLKATLERSNQQLQEFARAKGLVFAGKDSTLAEDRVKQLQDSLGRAQDDRAAKQARYEAAMANPEELMSDAVASGPLRQYQTDLQNLRRELAQLQTMYTPASHKVQAVEAQIAETEKAIQHERQDALARLRTEYLASAGLERLLSQTQASGLKTVEQQMDQERQYEVKKGEIDATQRLYESMLQKVKEAGAAAALRTTNVRIIDQASVPSIPYSPNPLLNLALGLAFGAVGGIALVLVRVGSDNKLKRPGELSLPEIPELGVIPSAHTARVLESGDRRGAVGELAVAAKDSASLWGESFRSVLSSIMFGENFHRLGGTQAGGRVLMVSSIDPMEGKTTVVANLGKAAAERMQRVLLIDADLRRPSLHERLGVSNDRGLADLLGRGFADFDGSSLEELVLPTRIPNLWMLPSGSVDAAASSLLYSYTMDLGALLRRFRKDFDLIVIDTPPMRLYADGRLLGQMADGVVMVVRANRVSREDLRSAYIQFAQDHIPVLGTILNDWKMAPRDLRTYKRYQDHYGQRPS